MFRICRHCRLEIITKKDKKKVPRFGQFFGRFSSVFLTGFLHATEESIKNSQKQVDQKHNYNHKTYTSNIYNQLFKKGKTIIAT
jgi:hypothetical protein